MAHDPSLGYADYFAAGSGGAGAGATLVPEVDAGDQHEMYGVGLHHQPTGVEMFGVRGLMAPVAVAAVPAQGNKDDALVHDDGSYALQFFRGEQQHRQLSQAPLSLSLHGPPDPDAASFMLHHQLSGGGDVTRHRQHQQTATATWLEGSSWHLRGSRFLLPTQQLLQEFCSIPAESTNPAATATKQQQAPKRPVQEDGGGGSSFSATSWPPTTQQIQAMDATELQRLKAKLYTMLEEVDRRYRRYREQMRAVAGSFEAVAGERTAAVYTRMASRTISRHFRSLRDGVAAQVRAVRRKLGEKDDGGDTAPGVTKGETPRLRALDQCLRQHKAYQSGMLEPHPWRPQRGLPERAVSVLRAWLFEHFLHPYPSDVDKHILARQTGLSRSQVSNWFINARVRLWKPMVEEMYAEEMKDKDQGISGGQPTQQDDDQVQNPNPGSGEDQKPKRAQLLHDAGSLASVVSIGRMEQQQSLGFGMIDHLGFDAYAAGSGHHGFGNGGGGGVSLTLGLQNAQFHADPYHRGGVNVAFAPASPSSSSATAQGGGAAAEFLFMPGEHQIGGAGGMHSAHGGQYVGPVVMEGADQHYRGLSATGFHLLRDLAG